MWSLSLHPVVTLALALSLSPGASATLAHLPSADPSATPTHPIPQEWPQTLPDVSAYPRPVPVTTVARAPEIPRLRVDPSALEFQEAVANEAVRIQVLGAALQPQLFGEAAPQGQTFLVLTTRWENIHPKEMVDRAALEGRRDRTMGVGAFSGGGGPPPEYVEADVAYQVPRLSDHVFALADGAAVSLHPATATLPRGRSPDDGLTLPSLGSVETFPIAFLVTEGSRDVALQFFDYSYGNVLVPVQGRSEVAAAPGASGEVLDRVETDVLEVSATGLTFRDRWGGEEAPSGWSYAVVTLTGQSLSAGGGVGNIVQLDPLEYAFLVTDGGYLRYAVGGSVNDAGMIRFTPEVPQRQELAFLMAEDDEALDLGLRLRNEVVTLELTENRPEGFPRREEARHEDGDVLELLLFGSRKEAGRWIVDLGLRPMGEDQGMEIQPAAQFILFSEGTEVGPDLEASARLPGAPPDPFIIPPGVPVRFHLVFSTEADAEGIRYRGFRSQGVLRF